MYMCLYFTLKVKQILWLSMLCLWLTRAVNFMLPASGSIRRMRVGVPGRSLYTTSLFLDYCPDTLMDRDPNPRLCSVPNALHALYNTLFIALRLVLFIFSIDRYSFSTTSLDNLVQTKWYILGIEKNFG